MTKNELEFGNVLELRNGEMYLYNCSIRSLVSLNGKKSLNLSDYLQDLKFIDETFDAYDIIKIYENYTLKKLIWEDKSLNELELAILRNINPMYTHIVIYNEKELAFTDRKNNYKFVGRQKNLFENLFKKFEKAKFYEIKEILKNKSL